MRSRAFTVEAPDRSIGRHSAGRHNGEPVRTEKTQQQQQHAAPTGQRTCSPQDQQSGQRDGYGTRGALPLT
jgi:hypothetical protein